MKIIGIVKVEISKVEKAKIVLEHIREYNKTGKVKTLNAMAMDCREIIKKQ